MVLWIFYFSENILCDQITPIVQTIQLPQCMRRMGPIVFRRKFCQILQASSVNSTAYCGKIVRITRLTAASHL